MGPSHPCRQVVWLNGRAAAGTAGNPDEVANPEAAEVAAAAQADALAAEQAEADARAAERDAQDAADELTEQEINWAELPHSSYASQCHRAVGRSWMVSPGFSKRYTNTEYTHLQTK